MYSLINLLSFIIYIHLWPSIGQLRHFLIILIQIDIFFKDKCHVYLGTWAK